MVQILDWLKGQSTTQEVTVQEGERMLVLRDGQYETILRLGTYTYPAKGMTLHRYAIAAPEPSLNFLQPLVSQWSDLAQEHFTRISAKPDQLILMERDGQLYAAILPEKSAVYWTDAGPWTTHQIDLTQGPRIPDALARRVSRAEKITCCVSHEVPPGSVGILYQGGVFAEVLEPGTYHFWTLGDRVDIKLVDTRWQFRGVGGQEMLTSDRVSLRVNLVVQYRVVDPLKAVSETTDYGESLYNAVQFAVREVLGVKTLDEALDTGTTIDDVVIEGVRAQMRAFGIEVRTIALKDIILPGEMRTILNQVVIAQKEAEANIIRRREETNATRSLLNTAKVMADNPMLMRLKELEALEAIADKVEHLTIHNGTEGLLSDVVKLRER